MLAFFLLQLVSFTWGQDVLSWSSDTSCTERSFSIPGWVVEGFVVEAYSNAIIASFGVTNRATDSVSNLTCHISNNGCYINGTAGDPSLQATVEMSAASISKISLQQSWECNDKKTLKNESKPLRFTATGSTAVTSSKNLIRASLTTPFRMSPKYFESNVTGTYSPTCSSPSNNFTWTVESLQYRGYNHSLPFGNPARSLDFFIVNNELGFLVKCSLILPIVSGTVRQPVDPNAPYNRLCWTVPAETWTVDTQRIGVVWTDIGFNETDLSMTITQSWFCEDHEVSEAYNVTALGTTVLQCIGTTRCELDSQNVAGTIASREHLPQFSYDPKPQKSSCLIDSIYTPYYTFGPIWVNDYDNSYANVSNPSLSDPRIKILSLYYDFHPHHTGWEILPSKYDDGSFDVYTYINVTDPKDSTIWKNTTIDGEHDTTLTVQHKFDLSTMRLTLFHNWRCSDKDMTNPIYFSASATLDLQPFVCRDPKYNPVSSNVLECAVAGYVDFDAVVSNGVNWTPDLLTVQPT